MIAPEGVNFDLFLSDEYRISFGYIRRITVRSIAMSLDSLDAVNDCRQYYFAEQVFGTHYNRILELDSNSRNVSLEERRQFDYNGKQSSVYQPWILYPAPQMKFDDDLFLGDSQGGSPRFQMSENNTDYDEDGDDRISVDNDGHGGLGADEQDEISNLETDRNVESHDDTNENFDGDTRRGHFDDSNLDQTSQVLDSLAIDEQVRCGPTTSVDGVGLDRDQNAGQNTVPENSTNVAPFSNGTIPTAETGWEETENIDYGRQNSILSFEDDERDCVSLEHLRLSFLSQEEEARRLWPCWWILYQSRWPPHLAPQHVTFIRQFRQRYHCTRASTLVLQSDLFRLGFGCSKQSVFFLVDSLVSFDSDAFCPLQITGGGYMLCEQT